MYKMSQKFIAENATASAISYRLPNKHYIPVPCVARVALSTGMLTLSQARLYRTCEYKAQGCRGILPD